MKYEDFTSDSARTPCVTCGVQHIERWRRAGWCLSCDVRDRVADGDKVDEIAGNLGLPRCLVRSVVNPVIPSS